ncbi:MAG: hypothetical protein Q8P67_06420 [archaeon]|nr:hypothetical protein [archaeon]
MDAQLALVNFSQFMEGVGPVCRAELVADSESRLSVTGLWHPVLAPRLLETSGQSFVPNDVSFDGRQLMVLTGPNMGGKTTLIRQVAVLVVLASLGCSVPASSCVMSPVDQIITRLGSSDDMVGGKSTFFTEMLQVSHALNKATSRSLVLLDELGRGTSTYDGFCVCFATIQHLLEVGCRTIVSTHYHQLSKEPALTSHPGTSFQHMGYFLHEESDGGACQEITFLYQLRPLSEGFSPASFGMHAARLAQLPRQLIDAAVRVSHGQALCSERPFLGLFRRVWHSPLAALPVLQPLALKASSSSSSSSAPAMTSHF